MAETVTKQIDNIRKNCSKKNWDSYGGKPIREETLSQISNITSVIKTVPWIVPTSDGGFQLEWHKDGLDIEVCFDSNGKQVFE